MSKTKLFLQGLTLFALALSAGCSSSNPNGYYENDGPPGLFQKKIFPWGGSEVKLKVEQPNKWANRPYTVMGKRYYPVTGDKAMNQVGTASWYGKQFHGKKTAIGEVYDMHAMTAAHPTMELPSFAKVTNLENGRSVIVRVNDRGPFLHGRIIDLSYAAAVKLGYQKKGTARVRVERITRRDIAAGRIPSTTADNAVLVASSSKKSTTAPAQTRTASAAPRQTQTTTYRQSTTQLTQTYEPAPAPAAEQTVTPAAKPAPIPSAQPRAIAANEGTLVSDTTAHNSKYDDQVYVTLSIPVENAETPPEEQTPVQNDAMGALIAQQETAPAQAPAEVLPSAIPAASTGSWSVQIGAYGVQENAKQAAAHAEMMLASVQNAQVRVVDTGKVWKVLSGNFASKDEASQFARTVTQALGSPAFAIAQ